MRTDRAVKLDEIGYWSEIKLDIIKDYATEYSKILTASARSGPPFKHVYIDGFAGAGRHISKTTREFVPGSPLNALLVDPPFSEYHFIDMNEDRVAALEEIAAERSNVTVHHGDCNEILLRDVFPWIQYKDYRRGLCLLDPYGLHLDWEVIKTAGQMESIEIFLNFPIMDMNMNVLKKDPNCARRQGDVERMNAFWGDESWREVAYPTTLNLFGEPEKASNEMVVDGFRTRLKKVAGFAYVPPPIPMRNTTGSTVYYLFFASHKPVAAKIVEYIIKKYASRGTR